MVFSLKRGDSRPALKVTVKEADGDLVDLTGATVTFHLARARDGLAKTLAGSVTVESAVDGTVRYDWAAADTAEAGDFQGEFRVDYGSGVVLTAPSEGHILVRIVDRVT